MEETMMYGRGLRELHSSELQMRGGASGVFAELFTKTDDIIGHNVIGGKLLLFLVLDKSVDSVKSYSTIVTDDTASSVCIGKTGNDVRSTASSHLGGVCIEASLVVSLTVYCEESGNLGINFISVVLACLLCHSESAPRLE